MPGPRTPLGQRSLQIRYQGIALGRPAHVSFFWGLSNVGALPNPDPTDTGEWDKKLLGKDDVKEAAKMLLDRGVLLVLISKGPDGAFYATRDFSGEVPSFDVGDIVDATGAGDAFLAASLVHLSDGPLDDEKRVREAALRGCAAGALACTDFGAMRALPTKDELEKFMSDG